MQQGHVLHYVDIGLICDIQKLETTHISHYRRIDTENGVHTMEYYSAIKNEDTLSFGGKLMDIENIIICEVTQIQKDMHGMYSLISGY